jgi:hypothetical protein
MQNPNLTPTSVLWLSACGAVSVWFLYWIFYDLIIWGKDLVQVNPLNYFGVAVVFTFMLFSGLGVRKIEALCYLGSTAAVLWFGYWILYDVLVWNKPLSQTNVVNYAGLTLSLVLVFVPKIFSSFKSKQRETIQAPVKANVKKQAKATKRVKKRVTAPKKSSVKPN